MDGAKGVNLFLKPVIECILLNRGYKPLLANETIHGDLVGRRSNSLVVHDVGAGQGLASSGFLREQKDQ